MYLFKNILCLCAKRFIYKTFTCSSYMLVSWSWVCDSVVLVIIMCLRLILVFMFFGVVFWLYFELLLFCVSACPAPMSLCFPWVCVCVQSVRFLFYFEGQCLRLMYSVLLPSVLSGLIAPSRASLVCLISLLLPLYLSLVFSVLSHQCLIPGAVCISLCFLVSQFIIPSLVLYSVSSLSLQ